MRKAGRLREAAVASVAWLNPLMPGRARGTRFACVQNNSALLPPPRCALRFTQTVSATRTWFCMSARGKTP